MDRRANDYEIPTLEAKLFYGLSTDVKGNAIFVNNDELLHPAGTILVIDNLRNGSQNFVKVPLSKKKISVIIISPNRNFVVVGEKGEKPNLSVYELSTQKRLKLLGVPLKESSATDWASVAFMKDNVHLIAVTGDPNWNYFIYDWQKGRVVSHGEATLNSLPITQVIPNPEDVGMFLILGPGLFRLMSQSDKMWRQYGFSRAENVPLQVACWLGPQLVLAGSRDGRLLLVEYGELRSVYEADKLLEIHITGSSEVVTLESNTVTEDNKKGMHEIRALTSFEKGFLYSCNLGEIYVFEKVTDTRWLRKNVIKISSMLITSETYDGIYQINNVTVNPSQTQIVCTSMKTELYISDIFFEQDFEKEPAAEFRLLGNGYHDGPIASISTCLWKPIFLTTGMYDKTIRLWNYELMKVIIMKKFADVIYSSSMHPSGFYCLLGFTDKLRFNLILVDDLKTVGHVNIRACKNVAFATGGHLFAATRDIIIEVYSAIFFTRLHVLSGHIGPVTRLVFSLRDKTLWTCGGEGSLYEWDIDTGKRIEDIFTSKNGQFGLTVQEAVYSAGTDGKLKEIMNGEIYREIDMQQGSLSCVILGNSGKLLFLGGQKGAVVSVLYPLVHPPKWQEFYMHSQPLADVIITHNDTTLISTSVDGFLCIWQITCSEEKRSSIVKSLPNLSEILISLEELEQLTDHSKDLGDRLLEIEGQHEYTIRQVTASNDAIQRETVSNYNAIVEDLKFRLKQKEREHLVEINKFQTNQKEILNSHQKNMEEQEQHFSKKLSDELKKTEELEKMNKKLKNDFERKKEEIEQQGFLELRETIENKDTVIRQKQQQIEQLQEDLAKVLADKDEMNSFLKKSFDEERVSIDILCKSQIKKADNLVKEMATENGIMNKQTSKLKEEIQKLISLEKSLNKNIVLKQKKIDAYAELIRKKDKKIVERFKKKLTVAENTIINKNLAYRKIRFHEIGMLKTELDVKENVICDKDKLIVQITKQNDAFNKDIKFRNTTVEALLQKIAPKEKELKNMEQILEKKNNEIYQILQLIRKKDKKIEAFKKKLSVAENTIINKNLAYRKIRFHVRKICLDLHIAASYAYQPIQLKNKILEMSEKYLQNHKEEIQLDEEAFKETTRQRARMESIIKKLKIRLSLKNPLVKHIYTPHSAVQQLLSEFNFMTSELQEQKREVKHLQTLLNLNHMHA